MLMDRSVYLLIRDVCFCTGKMWNFPLKSVIGEVLVGDAFPLFDFSISQKLVIIMLEFNSEEFIIH